MTGQWERCHLCDGKGWIANRDGGLADPPSFRCPRCKRTGFEPRYRCTGCGATWDLDDLQQIYPDGHDACPSADHEAEGEDPPLERIFKAKSVTDSESTPPRNQPREWSLLRHSGRTSDA